MFTLSEHHASDASANTVPRSGRQMSDTSTSLSNGDDTTSRKRKRSEHPVGDLPNDPFFAKPYPPSPAVKPRTLQPLMLLPRSQLPLSFIDIASSAKSSSQTRFFEAHVKILELEERIGSQPMVLIARQIDGRTLYAVEREARGLLVLCQLGSWVDLPRLRDSAVACTQSNTPIVQAHVLPATSTQPSATALDTKKFSQRKRLAIEALQSMVKRPTAASYPIPTETEYSQAANLHEVEENGVAIIDDVTLQPTAIDICENVRTHYFETLYLSKASLAYFAKGPLSRARAAFHLDHDSTLDMNYLINFLESVVLSTSLIDKKYRDSIASCISLVDIQDHSGKEIMQPSEKSKKRRTSKKIKAGKNGLYPHEDGLIFRWWRAHDDEAGSDRPESTKEEIMKQRISELRIRETQLQMIIILELLALQHFASPAAHSKEDLPALLPTVESTEFADASIASKKSERLTKLIDVHVDRLSIWQSVAAGPPSTSVEESQSALDIVEGPAMKSRHADIVLRDFCVDVIAPFFSARLPDRCSTINRKLGGPVAISPPKPRLSKSASFSGILSRPGAATKRPLPAKPRRSLQSVLTEDRERRSISRGPRKAIALMRSATMPTGTNLKKEPSEAQSLSSIPMANPFYTSKAGTTNLRRLSSREVDFLNVAPDNDAKAKKRAMVEAELKEAISALKKPNRQLAGKELVESAEKRTVHTNHPRKSKKPVRNPLFQGVQISATPISKRQRDFLTDPRPLSSSRDTADEDNLAKSQSSHSHVPQSATRLSQDQIYSTIQATPTRRTVLNCSASIGGGQVTAGREIGHFPSSPLHVRRSSAQLFISVPESTIKESTIRSPSYRTVETPLKSRAHGQAETTSNKENGVEDFNEARNSDPEQESIYASLGWDEVDDLA